MKKISLFVLAIFTMCFSMSVFAQAAAPAVQAMPDWVGSVLAFLTSIPKVGPILSTALVYVGSIAALFTALTVFARAVLGIPMVAAKFAGAQALSDKIGVIYSKVSYYLDQLSILNAKKK